MNPLAKKEADRVLHQLHEHGYRAHVVGGAVRDELLLREISDIDITTSAKPEEICELFNKAHQMNTKHQTVLVRSGQMHIEVTTERGVSLEEDLACRDFTINSMARTIDGLIIDPTDGQKDLANQVIRSADPKKRMSEDPLRMLRAIRFCSDLSFKIDSELLDEIKRQASSIGQVAGERIVVEWEKLLQGRSLQEAFVYLQQTELYRYLPGLKLSSDAMEQLTRLPQVEELDTVNRWTFYFLWIQKDAESAAHGLPLSNETKKQIKSRLTLFEYRLKNPLSDWVLYQYGLAVSRDVERLRHFFNVPVVDEQLLQDRWDSLPIKSSKELSVSGKDLMERREIPSGPWIKEELKWLEQQVINKKVNHSKEALLEAVERKRNDEK